MSTLLGPKLALARAAGIAARLRGGGGTSLPGKLLIRLDPGAIATLAGRLPRGSALISATNGKTTTAALASSIIEATGTKLVHNQAGANMAGGVASTLLAAAGRGAGIDGELGLFEVDEMWLDRLVAQLHPSTILLGNLFRDQLDRYGELDSIAERWTATVRTGAGAQARLVCNADDPLVADIGRESPDALYYGVDDHSLALEGMAHAADAKHCRRCGGPYTFDAIYLGHLGHYHCPQCGQTRPSPTVLARSVELEGVRSSRFRLCTPAGEADVVLALPGLYNVYNALAAAALAVSLGISLAHVVEGLQSTRAAFGRAESVVVDGRQARILLVKNPVGANEVLRTIALEPGSHDLLGILNDNIADGRDVSWIWDADFELLAGRVHSAVCSGARAPELALRLKYAGIEPERIEIVENLHDALARATGGRDRVGAGDATAPRSGHGVTGGGVDVGDQDTPLYVLPTYTAMLALRELLVRRGEAASSWRR
jgi:lipid II isoglutaminyl synthase (glutamine-hydrolysing)